MMKKISALLVVFSLMLASFTAGVEYQRGDVNEDGQVNIDDVTALINYLLTDQWPEVSHEWVDLGLPSGTLWATCNVGANAPEEYGDYFAWGETEPKEVYDLSTYKWCNGSENTLTKYCDKSDYGYEGYIDGKTELDPEDDAAYVNWGENWRMPTLDQQKELIDKCTWTWTTQNGVNGRLVTGPNGKTLFLPAAGYRRDSSLSHAGLWGDYWSRALHGYVPDRACFVFFNSGYVYWNNTGRCDGCTVRAVRVPQN